MNTDKYFDRMADQNKLLLGIPVSCIVCDLILSKEDRLFINPATGQIIHYDCFVSALTYKCGLNDK